MSTFAAKRKARKIRVQEDDDDDNSSSKTTSTPPPTTKDFDQEPALQASFKSRPFKQSSLRKSINIGDDADSHPGDSAEDDQDGGAPLRVRPSLGGGKASSSKIKKRASSSRLSFGANAEPAGDDEDTIMLGEDPQARTAKGSLAAAATENSAHKKGITKNSRLPLRSMETDEDRPRYSKEYLSELQSSTPKTPANIGTLHISDEGDGDVEMTLDPSEIEGATVVETSVVTIAEPTTILTDAEIREKKERRARLAQQGAAEDFISLSDDDDERGTGESYLSTLSKRQPSTTAVSQKKEKRLVADENLDDDDSFFVEDGGLSLGARAERDARRRKRADMASMIAKAEGAGEDGEDGATSDDSEAERRAAYEAAQTRAGMDGLAEEREQQRRRLGRAGAVQVPPKITPLPDLSVLVGEFKARMGRKQLELDRMRSRIGELRLEREGIERREPEVQQLLNEAGERYRTVMGGGGSGEDPPPAEADGGGNGNGNGHVNGGLAAARSFLGQARPGDTPGRGLESLGTTPLRAEQMEL